MRAVRFPPPPTLRNPVVAARSGGRLLSESSADTQPWRREPLFMPLSCPSLLSKAIPAHSRRAVIEPGTASDGIRSSQGPLKLSFSTGKCTSARRDYGFESAFLRRPLPSNGKELKSIAELAHRSRSSCTEQGMVLSLPSRVVRHSRRTRGVFGTAHL
jgi:hypothetical protein